MSHRTESLPGLSGLPHVIRELRYHEGSRQSIGLLLALWFAVVAQPVSWLLYAATPVLLVGIGVRLWASGFIIKNRTLATNGPYAIVRHPLYVGNILIIMSFAVASGLWWAVLLAIAFLGFYYPTAIEYEDRKLSAIFGAVWREFAKHTPALLPTFRPPQLESGGGRWSFRMSLSNNYELVVSLYLLSCFAHVLVNR